jgi:hypothetical protein
MIQDVRVIEGPGPKRRPEYEYRFIATTVNPEWAQDLENAGIMGWKLVCMKGDLFILIREKI